MGNSISTREAFSNALLEFGENYSYFVLDADLSKATGTHKFAKSYPGRFANIGIAECNMMGVAAGIASCGEKVVASTFAMFAAGRAYEQVRTSIAYVKRDVVVVGTHGGVLIGEDGATHQCIEDISLMRTIPNMKVIVPCDGVQTKFALKYALENRGPVYLRLGRLDIPTVYRENEEDCFVFGKANVLKRGVDITIAAVGEMVYPVLEAEKKLEKRGINARVLDMSTVKPIDREALEAAARETDVIFTVEDHNVIGGLGSSVVEALDGMRSKVVRIGINDCFGLSGKRPELAEKFGLSPDGIFERILSEL